MNDSRSSDFSESKGWILLKRFRLLLLVVFAVAAAQAVEAAETKKLTASNGIFQTPAEFQALRNAAARLYGSSIDYWQRVLRSELRQQEMQQTKRVEEMRTEAAQLQSAYASEFSDASRSIEQGQTPERDLVVLAAGLRALALIDSTRTDTGGWDAAQKILVPLRRELRKSAVRPDIRVFVGSLLIATDINLDRAALASATAEDVLEAVELGQGSATEMLKSINHGLLLMLHGDALFAQFRYRDSLRQYNKSYRMAAELGDDNLLRLARMRQFWAAYRSGDFAASINAFQETCSVDVLHWETRASPEEHELFEEMGRMAGIVLLRSNNQDLVDRFANEKGSGSCRSSALVSLIERHQGTGRFSEAIAVFKRYFSVLSDGPEFAAASLMARSAAGRDRPGIEGGQWRQLVALAAPVLGRTSRWEQRFNAPSQRRNRERFVQDYVLEAADAYYNDAFKGRDTELFQRAAQLYDIRLLEEDRFEERGRTEFRLAFALAQLGRNQASFLRTESALQTGLVGDDRKAAFELRCELAKKDAWEGRSPSRLGVWTDRCLDLVRAFPTARSLQHLTDATYDLGSVDAKKAGAGLREGLTLVAARPAELRQVGDRFLVVLRELLVQSLAAEELLAAFSQSEVLLRPALGTPRMAAFEQANYSSFVSFVALQRSNGKVTESLAVMRRWLEANGKNSFALPARAELVERLFELRMWQELDRQASEVLGANGAGNESADQREVRLKAGVDVDRARVRLLRALAQESRLEFEKAFENLTRVEADGAAQSSAAAARKLILQRYSHWIPLEQQRAFARRCFDRDSGLSDAEKSKAHLTEITWLLAEKPARGAERDRAYDGARAHLRAVAGSRAADGPAGRDGYTSALAVVVDAKRVLAGSGDSGRAAKAKVADALDDAGLLSRMDQRAHDMAPAHRSLARNIVSREVEAEAREVSVAKQQTIRGSSFARVFGAVSRLPGVLVDPKAGLALAEAWTKSRETPAANVAAYLVASIKERAGLPDEPGLEDVNETRDVSALIQLLVRRFGFIPQAADLVAFVGPNHPVLTDVSLYGIPGRLSDGVIVDSQ